MGSFSNCQELLLRKSKIEALVTADNASIEFMLYFVKILQFLEILYHAF